MEIPYNVLVTILFVFFGLITSLKLIRYFLSFLYINGDRVHLKYIELIEPVVFQALSEAGETEKVKEIVSVAYKLRVWVFVWTLNLYGFISFLILCGWS